MLLIHKKYLQPIHYPDEPEKEGVSDGYPAPLSFLKWVQEKEWVQEKKRR
jgi:hypothetical protein